MSKKSACPIQQVRPTQQVRPVRLARPIFVVADDLTGAAEIAGIASSYGLDTDLLTAMPDGVLTVSKDVTVLATDTRSANECDAVEMTRSVARALPGDVLLFKKTDSALRGHIMAEIRAWMDAMLAARVLFIPANPSKGRIIQGGIYYVGGIPISQTAFAHDPEFPALTSSVYERFPEAEGMEVLIPDVSSADDIRHWLNEAGGNALLVGAADLFVEILRLMGLTQQSVKHDFCFPSENVLVVCGSTQSRPDLLPVPVASMPLGLYNGDTDVRKWVAEVAPVFAAHHAMALAIPHHHLTGKEVAVRLRETMAEMVRSLFAICRPDDLVIEGGATAFACCRALGFSHFHDICQLAPGVVRMCAENGMRLTLKPGSYMWNGPLP
jgi:uncharacterized protein YgbK (DUF1537 family)